MTAIENGAARLVWRVRVVQRHDAFLPWPTNTPAPALTDDLLPMMTLGCGDRLDRVPSGQMISAGWVVAIFNRRR